MVGELVSCADLLVVLLVHLLEEVDQSEGGDQAFVVYWFLVGLLETKDAKMFNDHGICLLSSCCLMGDSVQRSFHTVYGHPCLVSLVDTDPPEAYQLQLPLKILVN